jgi:hypothetical protein
MGRRKITEEAENGQTEQSDQDDEEREQLTQRMPKHLVGDVDDLADELGMSRNSAINMLVKRGLDDF